MFDSGHGIPFLFVPGIQGRWEWIRPAVDTLARRERALAFSSCDEPTSGFRCDPRRGFANYVEQIEAALDRAGVERAVVIGVSFGGLAAFEFAARRPDRVTGLVLASALPIDWIPDRRARFYMRAPRLLSPLFCAATPARLYPEIATAYPRIGPRISFVATQGLQVLRAFLSPARMARRVRWAEAHAFADPSAVTAPAMIVTGERGLDRVVPTEVSERCLRGLPNARRAVLARTGHIGVMTRPDAFANLVVEFARGCLAPPLKASVR